MAGARRGTSRLPSPGVVGVGIADGRTGLYAVAGPGGWPIIGRTTYKLFDPDADNPFPIAAGMRVRFVAIDSPETGL